MNAKKLGQMIVYEEAFSRGKSAEIRLDGKADSAPIASLFLRAFRGRVDLSSLVTQTLSPDFVKTLEKLRNHLFSGELAAAEATLEEAAPSSELEQAEILVEICRLNLFKGRLIEALAASDAALGLGSLAEVSKMTCLQLRGHIRILRKEYQEAVIELNRALALAEVFSSASSAFSARAFLIQAYSELGDREPAARALEHLLIDCETIPQEEMWLDRLLTVIRAEAQFHRIFGNPEKQFACLTEGLAISEWLNERTTAKKCQDELSACTGSGASPVFRLRGWAYLPERELILNHSQSKIVRLRQSPVAKKILTELIHGPKPADELYRSVWGREFHPLHHGNQLRATLSKVRKLLPPGALVIEESVIKLI